MFMTKMALAELEVGRALDVVVNDENSKHNVLRYLWNHGQEVVRSGADGPDFHIVVRKSTERRADRPLPAVGPCGTRWDSQ
ncbi:MAG: sulfurtransferase TusA family protein [Nitrososphaerota archaeon]|nr:sulfurtransferase TusA family protein [Nitrososphaerota archaeon]